jgi:O-antigen/teichoic acid export membrane protein
VSGVSRARAVQANDGLGTARAALAAVMTTMGARSVVLLSGLASTIVLTRALGPEGRGQYFAVATVAALLAQFANLGLSSSNTFLAARDPALAWPLTCNSLWLAAVLSAGSALIIAAWGASLAHLLSVPARLLWAVPALGPAILLFTLVASVMAAQQRFTALNVWQTVNAVLGVLLLVACLTVQAGVAAFLAATAVGSIIVATAASVGIAGAGGLRWSWPRLALIRIGAGYSLAAYSALLASFLNQRIGVLYLGRQGHAAEIGYFSVAAQWHDVLLILPSAIGMVLFPALVRSSQGAWHATRRALVISIALTLLACAVLAALAGPIIRGLFGAAFQPAVPVLRAILPAVVAISGATIVSQFLAARTFSPTLVVAWTAGLAVTCAADAVLVPAYGAIGAAWAQSAGTAVAFAGLLLITASRILHGPESSQSRQQPL